MISIVDIFLIVTLPLITLIVVGYVTQSFVPETTKALNYLHTNVVLPCFLVQFISTSTIALSTTLPVIGFTIVQSVVVGTLAWQLARLLAVPPAARSVVAVAGSMANTGNFGVPLAILAYPPEYTVYHAVIAATTLIMFAGLGPTLLAPLASDRTRIARASLHAAMHPIVLGVIAGCLMRAFGLRPPLFLAKPLQMLADSYTTIALLGLGAALYGMARYVSLPLLLSVTFKVLLAPIITLALGLLFGFSGTMLTLLVVAASMPTAVVVGVMAAQNQRSPEIATATVFVSTILAPIVVSAWLLVMRMLTA